MIKIDFIVEAVKQNSHWETGLIELYRFHGIFVNRPVFMGLKASAESKFITLLRGLRRTGKSVLARSLMREMLEKGEGPQSLAWFEFDREMAATPDDLDSLLTFFASKGVKFVALDEIAFVAGWQDVLKRFYDRSDTKFVVTGSSALELDQRSSESLAGRFTAIDVQPFSMRERLALKGSPFSSYAGSPLEDATILHSMEQECSEYLRCGGLPEATLSGDEERSTYINKSLLNPLLYKDAPAVFERADPDLLRKTLELLSATASSTYQLQGISSALACSHPTAAAQVSTLERALLVRTALNYTPSIAKQKRTSKKIVFTDNGILSSLNSAAGTGTLAENAAFNALGASYFWRDSSGREVDCILPGEKIAVEIKYQESVSGSDEKNLHCFLSERKGWRGAMITKHFGGKGDFPRIPLWKLLMQGTRALEDALGPRKK